jgi:hypothetical protein
MNKDFHITVPRWVAHIIEKRKGKNRSGFVSEVLIKGFYAMGIVEEKKRVKKYEHKAAK